MEFTDTHCHIHSKNYPLDTVDVINDAKKDGVTRLICVGTDLNDSVQAVDFVQNNENCYASIGLHPHDAKHYDQNTELLEQFASLVQKPKVIAIGECGLDYFYNRSEKHQQRAILEFQLDLAQKHNLPVIFHVREAFEDFWPILDNFKGIRGVIHSFSADTTILEAALSRDLYIGLNGIMTFSKNAAQITAATKVPLDRILIETDAPFLTPVPFRGTICQPKHVRVTAEFLADLRGDSLETFARSTHENATKLFNL